jgi:microcystin-dependent protein
MDRANPHAHSIADPGHAHAVGNLHPNANHAFTAAASGATFTSPGVGTQGTDTRGTGIGIYGTDINHLHSVTSQDINHLHAVPNLTINPDGGSQPHNLMTPYLALNYIIRDGT